ncbi:hypothetical protein [Sphingomonas bacterium]|uniref:hypothetical protein n=1 Tax=Sphingomonas bacterium TaxID=1895847 RepID=UPI001C2D4B5D|nr:hypothetical protein [Sphingomonas bacterium]
MTVVITSSVVTAAICSMMTLGLLQRMREAVVFRGDHLVAYESTLRVWSGSIHHGRGGPDYRISLRDYPGRFEIPAFDYLSAFGPVEHTNPNGYCVGVTVQRAGKATRIMAVDGLSLPEGSLQRCPAWVG